MLSVEQVQAKKLVNKGAHSMKSLDVIRNLLSLCKVVCVHQKKVLIRKMLSEIIRTFWNFFEEKLGILHTPHEKPWMLFLIFRGLINLALKKQPLYTSIRRIWHLKSRPLDPWGSMNAKKCSWDWSSSNSNIKIGPFCVKCTRSVGKWGWLYIHDWFYSNTAYGELIRKLSTTNWYIYLQESK